MAGIRVRPNPMSGNSDLSIQPAGLGHLSGLTRLQSLDLRGADVTDAGVARLTGSISLLTLSLQGTRVTEAGTAELKRVLPFVQVGK